MSKDVIIAGAIAAGCVALVAVALLAPKSKSGDESAKTSDPVATTTVSPDPFAPLPGDLGYGPSSGSAAFGPGSFGTSGFPPAPTTAFGTGTGAATGFPPAGAGGFAPTTLPPATGFGPGTGVSTLNPPVHALEPAPTSAAGPSTTEHVVVAGETLGDISLKYYKTSKQWKRIVDANPGLDPRTVKVGQKLKIVLDQPAAVATAAAPVAGPGERTYTIKSNDSLYGIAKRELGSGARWKEIQGLNPGLDHNDLKVGKVIKLPAASGAATTGAEAAPGTIGGRTHTVAKGETLADISKKYFGTAKRWKEFVSANPGVNPEGLKVGQKLIIPASAKPAGGAGAEAVPGAALPAAEGEYTVKSGDTPSSIAQAQIGGKDAVQKLLAANPGLNPKALRIGQKLKIPGKPAPAGAAALPPAVNPVGVGGFPPAGVNQPVDPWAAPAGGGFGASTASAFGPGPGGFGPPADFSANPYAPGGPDAWNNPAPTTPGTAPGASGRR
jgi:nucleoid-associated protein YgaU